MWKVAIGNTLDADFLKQGYVPVKYEAKHGNTTNRVEYRNGNFILESKFEVDPYSRTEKNLILNIFLKREIMDYWRKVTNDFQTMYGIKLDDSVIYESCKNQSNIDILSIENSEGIDIDWMINIIQYAKEQGIIVDEEQFEKLCKIREENQKTQADE